ncbi:Tetratricopeptide TPR_1 repeat-containing protein [Pseudopedobacter saltans DSM 12145]|uniref:Tetratricopeptide TPR_1 repeat-containing protein n=1 Tax=Pseudopedobacter saltans (strain ATCC 51119 / DSM 12145 / JCM 21818 / CCUG 39354 / LMG 10337 / NBRC 100064 / NCIMB 13643) TaxID=762903 RepID=F0SBI5_PSESL|nr:tetratricopeptide repeat protein [Pseudopedobacter saltans]ADY51631.1 Tetratricopeptide TPR_1 repeat-containing protein [Pseudopedobacter saltans DSM 12145]
MKKVILGAVIFSVISGAAFAQKSEITSAKNNYALFELSLQTKATLKKQLEPLNLAKTSIDKAIMNEKTKSLPEAWAYRGLIYSAIAVTDTIDRTNSDAAFKNAQESITEAKKLDKDNKEKTNIANAERNLSIVMQNRGISAFNKKDFKDAYNSFKYIADVMPEDSTYNMYTAMAASSAQLPDEAIKYYNKTITLNKKNAGLYQELSRLYLSKSDTTKALKTIEEGRTQHPENLNLIFDELNIYLNRGQVASQISKIETAISKDPKNKTLHFVAGIAYNANKQADKAEAAYKKALEIDPNYSDAIYNLSILYIDKGNAYITEANKLPTNKSTEAKYNSLKAKFEGELRNALPLLEKARELNPKDLNTLTTLREVYTKLNMMDKAAQMKKAISEL